MPETIQLPMRPIGYTLAPSLGGEDVPVRTMEFLTSEDGNDFISRLEGVSECYAAALAISRVRPSQVDNFLAVVAPDRTATVYCNELRMLARIRRRVARPTPMAVGQLLTTEDIADIDALELRDSADNVVVIPPDHGVAFILSHGWRKGVFFDYSVFDPDAHPRTVDLPRLFGHFMARLVFQQRFSMTEDQWRRLLDWGWFPFTALTTKQQQTLQVASHFEQPAVSQLEDICREVAPTLSGRMEAWRLLPLLNQQMDFLIRARERLEAGDYLSCLSLLVPRIEGVLWTFMFERSPGVRPTQRVMVDTVVGTRDSLSVLLPNRFEEYLRRVYFRNFDLAAGNVTLSRNAHGHGVSQAGDYNFVRAIIGFLTLDQIYYYLSD